MLPEAFRERMRGVLGDGADALFAELDRPDPVHALRVNTEKITTERFLSLFPADCRPIPYAENGFLLNSGKIGNTPYHHAGMFYLQDPAAMSTLYSLVIEKGWRILDTCAAPGGKSSQASANTGDGGLVVSNEYVAARGRVLSGNLERLGCRNTIVTNVDTAVLGDWYPGYFDLVIADVPCSGEGMFRKSAEAVADWSPENVAFCAVRQREILGNIAGCVREGGYLLYSTCTFSTEENEENVEWFLNTHPEYELIPVTQALRDATADGVNLHGVHHDLSVTRRFYPHLCPGEGQYMALMRRTGNNTTGRAVPAFRETAKPLTRDEEKVLERFLDTCLTERPHGRFCKYRDTVCVLPEFAMIPPFGVISAGVAVGEIVKGRLDPAHHFFMAYGTLFRNRIELSASDTRVAAYLHGNVIPVPGCPDGWAAVLFEGCTLGGCKIVGEMAKNHYPKGLRIP